MCIAAAERKSAPILVESVTASSTAILRAPRHSSSTPRGAGRLIAQSAPRVSSNPVSAVSISRSAVYTGTSSPRRSMMPATAPFISLLSVKSDTGTHPAFKATSITVGLSAINTPFSGSSLFLSCAPVNLTKTSSSGALKSVISCILAISDSANFIFLFYYITRARLLQVKYKNAAKRQVFIRIS